MKLGLQINAFNWKDWPHSIRQGAADLAQAAEEAGFHSVWAMDHFFQLDGLGPADDPMLEVYTLLGYLAAVTQRVKLGAMVTGTIYRYPAILIKTVTTLDILSGGRAYFGIGAGWFEREARGLGTPFPPLQERFERFEETLQIAHQMWSTNNGPYHGKHFQLAETLCSPQPISQPRPPILIGGTGKKKTLRFVAQYGDACNLWYSNMGDLKERLDALEAHCRDIGRNSADIEKTVINEPPEKDGKVDAKAFIAECQRLKEAGVSHWIVEHNRLLEAKDLDVFGAEIIPSVADL